MAMAHKILFFSFKQRVICFKYYDFRIPLGLSPILDTSGEILLKAFGWVKK
jgi:hypothetical protein